MEGQPPRRREVQLGCVFTQTATDNEGWPVRDEDSTAYVAAIETAEQFGLRLHTEAWRRGGSRAQKKVVLGDGPVWIWNLAEQHFPGAVQTVDLYHARQHIGELVARLFSLDERARKRWAAMCIDNLATDAANESDYFERNAERMSYPKLRAQGLFVGSGVVEAGCKTVAGKRLKCSGVFWSVRGANANPALRRSSLSRRLEDYWEPRSRAA